MTKFSVIITAGGTSSRYGHKNKLLEFINKENRKSIPLDFFDKTLYNKWVI